jgi:hypothetical protein
LFAGNGGEQGVQRPVLPPGTLVPMHPVGFLVLTCAQTFGSPVSPDMLSNVGLVTTLEGDPLPSGDIAGRLGGFSDIQELESEGKTDQEIVEVLLGSKNDLHNNYQDFPRFLDNGGKIGLQHDPLLYGAFLLNPFLVKVERAPMLVVNQGEVAVIKSYLGLSTQDTSGQEFKFGSIVRPGHRGIWSEPLRTGKYPLNPRVYRAEVVPTAILTLNWAEATSHAHNLDAQLSSIDAKSPEGFSFLIDLQVQIHVPDTMAPKVISMVETMLNLVNEVLQSAVGNYFRNTLQGLPAVQFIETRQDVQDRAERYITECLGKYSVETRACISKTWCYPRRWCRSFRPVSSRCSSGRRSRGSRRRSSLASMSRRPRAPRTRNRYLPAHRSTSTCRRTTRRLAPQRRRVRPTSRG